MVVRRGVAGRKDEIVFGLGRDVADPVGRVAPVAVAVGDVGAVPHAHGQQAARFQRLEAQPQKKRFAPGGLASVAQLPEKLLKPAAKTIIETLRFPNLNSRTTRGELCRQPGSGPRKGDVDGPVELTNQLEMKWMLRHAVCPRRIWADLVWSCAAADVHLSRSAVAEREMKNCPRLRRRDCRPTGPLRFGRAIAVNWFQQPLFRRAGPHYHTISVTCRKSEKNLPFCFARHIRTNHPARQPVSGICMPVRTGSTSGSIKWGAFAREALSTA